MKPTYTDADWYINTKLEKNNWTEEQLIEHIENKLYRHFYATCMTFNHIKAKHPEHCQCQKEQEFEIQKKRLILYLQAYYVLLGEKGNMKRVVEKIGVAGKKMPFQE